MIGIVFTWKGPMKQQQGKLFVLKADVKLPPVSMTTHIFPQETYNDCVLIEVLVCVFGCISGWLAPLICIRLVSGTSNMRSIS
jgi:hypothetical protein